MAILGFHKTGRNLLSGKPKSPTWRYGCKVPFLAGIKQQQADFLSNPVSVEEPSIDERCALLDQVIG